MPYINTVDINGTTYYFENLTDGNHVVDLPALQKDDTFVLQGDVVDNLTDRHANKPLSAQQGFFLKRKDDELDNKISNLTTNTSNKDKELDNKITKLSEDTSKKDTELDNKIDALSNNSSQQDAALDAKISELREDMGTNDESTLSSAKTYADGKCSAAITSANGYTDNAVSESKEETNSNLAKKLDKAGGKVTGALEVAGVLTADQKLQAKYGVTIYQRGDVSKEITAVCTGENAGKFIGKSETDLARISVATPVNNDDAATKKYVDERVSSVGGAGIDYFDVYAEVKYSYVEIMDGFYVSNCLVTATFDEIKEALDAGKTPRIIETNSLDSRSLVGGIMSLYSYDSDYFVFTGVSRSANSASGLAVITIQADGTVMYRVAAGELPAVKDTDNGKMLIVSGGEWALQRVPGATVDAELSTTSENPVQNKTVTDALNGKLPKTGGTVTGALRTNDSFSAGGTIAFGEAPIVLSQTADGAAEIHSGTADVDDNPPPLARLKVARPTEDDDAATKKYVDDRAVRYDAAQGLTPDQKLVACSNIGAVNEKRAWVEGEVVLLPRGADGALTINITPSENSNDYTLALDGGPENVPVRVTGVKTPTDADTNAVATVEYVYEKVSDATILTSPNGTKYKITVSDDGKLSAVAVN